MLDICCFLNLDHKLGSNEQVVAVKQLNLEGLQGNQEFIVEVLMLSLLHHPNLVNLIGYCTDGDQRLLVYEFMQMGSLENHLFGTFSYCWISQSNSLSYCFQGFDHSFIIS